VFFSSKQKTSKMGASASSFTDKSIPDQTNHVIAITGGNIGLGLASGKLLLAAGAAKVILLCRSAEKGKEAADELNALGFSGHAEFQQLDLADLDSVRQAAQAILTNEKRLDALILNAGVMVPPFGLTKQGFETTFGVNNLGHFAFALPLVPLLRQAPSGRIVSVSSGVHRNANATIDWSDIATRSKGYSAWSVYGDSKLCNLLFTRALQSRLTKAGITNLAVLSSHPGYTATNLQQTSFVSWFNFVGMAPEQGALTQVRAATDLTLKPNDYIGPDGWGGMRGYPVVEVPSTQAQDDALAEQFWTLAENKTNVRLKL
jgi:NAD(P)-dependent dehydrogenase (short-subunit alcohol dehydrogenase family)